MNIEILEGDIDARTFRERYVMTHTPLLVKGYSNRMPAIKKWTPSFFSEKFGSTEISTKRFSRDGEVVVTKTPLDQYVESLSNYERALSAGESIPRPAYWHDVPIFQMFGELVEDLSGFDPDLLPSFYSSNWSQYVQFFMGPAGSVTRLHFDTLRTHNLFFELYGKKVWTLFSSEHFNDFGRIQWRWFELDPERPDFTRFPAYAKAKSVQVTIDAGDLLYIPPGTLHHVRSLDACISFNIDFHTASSVTDSLRFIRKGMPREVMFYNMLSFLGLVFKVPQRVLFPFYRSYLSYVS